MRGVGRDIKVEKANVLFGDSKTLTLTKDNVDLVEDDIIPSECQEQKKMSVVFWDDGVDTLVEYKPHLEFEASHPEVESQQAAAGSSSSFTINELAGFEYLGGYFSKKDAPELSTPANEAFDEEKFVPSEWIKMRNFGKLGVPTHVFMNDIIKMYDLFCKFHASANPSGKFAPMDLSRLPNVIRDYAAILKEKYPQYKDTALNRIARALTHFRKRNIKQKLRMNESMRSARKKNEYRHAKPNASTRAAKAWAEKAEKTNAVQEVVPESDDEVVSPPKVRKSQRNKAKK